MDNYATHKKAEVRDWLTADPRIHVHFTPTSGCWLNLVEVWFGIIERRAIHRGTFGSVKDLNAKIRAFVNGWNDRCFSVLQGSAPANSVPTATASHDAQMAKTMRSLHRESESMSRWKTVRDFENQDTCQGALFDAVCPRVFSVPCGKSQGFR